MRSSSDRGLRGLAALVALIALTSMLAGCATGGDSDMPWNTPQPWEGSPTIPGLPSYRD